jgi:hypothetical protein
MHKLILTCGAVASLLFSSVTLAKDHSIHFSPALKISDFRGADFQVGLSQVADFDALYVNYGYGQYKTERYDENVQYYRIGFQHQFVDRISEGFQAEIGLASYDGVKMSSAGTSHLEATGVSVGGAYIYQVNSSLAMRLGMDYSFFAHESTHLSGDSLIAISFGLVGRF